MSIQWLKHLFEFIKTIGEGTLVAGDASKDLVSDTSCDWHHISLNVVSPGVDLRFLRCISTMCELGIISGEVPRDGKRVAYDCARLILKNWEAPCEWLTLQCCVICTNLHRLQVFCLHKLGNEAYKERLIVSALRVVKFLFKRFECEHLVKVLIELFFKEFDFGH